MSFSSDITDPLVVAEFEQLISKLAHGVSSDSFTKREQELIEHIRQHSDVILPQIRLMSSMYKGRNDEGKAKIERLAEAIEKICSQVH